MSRANGSSYSPPDWFLSWYLEDRGAEWCHLEWADILREAALTGRDPFGVAYWRALDHGPE